MRLAKRLGLVALLVVGAVGIYAGFTRARAAGAEPTMLVYKSPACGCCTKWVEHIEKGGIRVTVEEVTWDELDRKLAEHGVPSDLWSCHLGVVDGYAVVGHVPVDVVGRMLREAPPGAGVSVPGMPVGSPGMEQGGDKDPYDVILFTRDGRTSVFESR